MITSFPNFYCAIHADAHKHHIKQIVHLTYARPMCCVYSTRFTFPRSLPFLPKLTQIERKLILEGPICHHSHGCFYEGSHRIHRYRRLVSGLHLVKHCETSGTQTAEKEPLPSASMSCMGAWMQASLGWVDSQ